MNKNEPLYITIKNSIKDEILSGKLKAGDKIPSVRNYAIENRININTVSNAFHKLDEEGLTIIERGQGRFVTQNQQIIKKIYEEKTIELVEEFIENMKALGHSKEKIVKILKEYDEA